MLGLFAFVSPWLLIGLAALPVLWFLLRVTPPSPRRTDRDRGRRRLVGGATLERAARHARPAARRRGARRPPGRGVRHRAAAGSCRRAFLVDPARRRRARRRV